MPETPKKPTSKTRAALAEAFLASLQEGRIPWRACWQASRPYNVASKKPYRGINSVYLIYVSERMGWTDPRFCTFRQAQERGWKILKGSHGLPVEYWSYYDPKLGRALSWPEARVILMEDPEAEQRLQLRCRSSVVFNAAQIEGIPELVPASKTNIDEIRSKRDTLLKNMRVGYRELGQKAYYSPSSDTITLPPETSFDDPYAYACTFLHECGHATGHPDRLNRDLSGAPGSESYAREELRAEIASAFTAQALGLSLTDEQLEHHLDLHKAYIQAWASRLAEAPEELLAAIREAERISDFLITHGEFQRQELGKDQVDEEIRCGDIHYKLFSLKDGGMKLEISGQGPLPDFKMEVARPYQADAEKIREITVGPGITAVGSRAFCRLPNLERIQLPESVERLGYWAAEGCPKLREIQYDGSRCRWTQVQKGFAWPPQSGSAGQPVQVQAADGPVPMEQFEAPAQALQPEPEMEL